jgi:hypothetical protein
MFLFSSAPSRYMVVYSSGILAADGRSDAEKRDAANSHAGNPFKR